MYICVVCVSLFYFYFPFFFCTFLIGGIMPWIGEKKGKNVFFFSCDIATFESNMCVCVCVHVCI